MRQCGRKTDRVAFFVEYAHAELPARPGQVVHTQSLHTSHFSQNAADRATPCQTDKDFKKCTAPNLPSGSPPPVCPVVIEGAEIRTTIG